MTPHPPARARSPRPISSLPGPRSSVRLPPLKPPRARHCPRRTRRHTAPAGQDTTDLPGLERRRADLPGDRGGLHPCPAVTTSANTSDSELGTPIHIENDVADLTFKATSCSPPFVPPAGRCSQCCSRPSTWSPSCVRCSTSPRPGRTGCRSTTRRRWSVPVSPGSRSGSTGSPVTTTASTRRPSGWVPFRVRPVPLPRPPPLHGGRP